MNRRKAWKQAGEETREERRPINPFTLIVCIVVAGWILYALIHAFG